MGDPDPPTLAIANGLFLQQGLPFEPAFLSGAQRRFDAAPETVDFAGDPTGSVEAINTWVSDRTKGLIPQVLDSLPDEMALALANAAYLDADWKHPFEQSRTGRGVFHRAAGEITVDFMHQTESLRSARVPVTRRLPCRTVLRSCRSWSCCPWASGSAPSRHRLDGRALPDRRNLSTRAVILSLPRFHLNTEAELT